MAGSVKLEILTAVVVADSELNSLANNDTVLGKAYNNETDLAFEADLVLSVDFASAPTAGAVIEVYKIPYLNGAYVDDGVSSDTPNSTDYVGCFVLRATTAAQVISMGNRVLLGGRQKFVFYNKSGQAFPASGSTVYAVPYRSQYT